MTGPALRGATYEDLLKVPDHLVAELIDGELYVSPRPASRHALAASRLQACLATRFDDGESGPGGWWIILEPELNLSGQAVVPNIVGWRRERMPVFPDTATFDLAPDWLCEVFSPSTARLDRVEKLPVYLKHGVRHVWFLDPIVRTLEVLRLEEGGWTVAGNYGDNDIIRAEPFDAVELHLGSLWIDAPPVTK